MIAEIEVLPPDDSESGFALVDHVVEQIRRPCVYFVQSGPHGRIKIGRTTKLRERLAAFRTSSPYPVRVIALIRGAASEEEAELHRRFASIRRCGEWFDPSDELVRHILEVADVVLSAPEFVSIEMTCVYHLYASRSTFAICATQIGAERDAVIDTISATIAAMKRYFEAERLGLLTNVRGLEA
jgi:hypothetical protein